MFLLPWISACKFISIQSLHFSATMMICMMAQSVKYLLLPFFSPSFSDLFVDQTDWRWRVFFLVAQRWCCFTHLIWFSVALDYVAGKCDHWNVYFSAKTKYGYDIELIVLYSQSTRKEHTTWICTFYTLIYIELLRHFSCI